MPRWLRFIRGMAGIGLTFAAGVGVVSSVLGAIAVLRGNVSVIDVLRDVGRFSVVAFILGVAFSGVLAIVARRGRLKKLSLALGAALGTGAGLLYWGMLAMTGGRAWTPRLAVVNLVVLVVMGAASGTATLLIARRAGAALGSGSDLETLPEGEPEFVRGRGKSKVEASGRRD